MYSHGTDRVRAILVDGISHTVNILLRSSRVNGMLAAIPPACGRVKASYREKSRSLPWRIPAACCGVLQSRLNPYCVK